MHKETIVCAQANVGEWNDESLFPTPDALDLHAAFGAPERFGQALSDGQAVLAQMQLCREHPRREIRYLAFPMG